MTIGGEGGLYLQGRRTRTEELLRLAGLFDDLNYTGSQLLDAGNVAGEDTHVSGLGGNVDLDTVVPRNPYIVSWFCSVR